MLADRRFSVRLTGGAALACLLLGGAPSAGQFSKAQLTEGNPDLAKVSSHLLRTRALAGQDRSAAQIAASVPSLQFQDGLPRVAVRLESLTPALVEELRGRGLRIDSFHLDYARVYGRVDPADLHRIAALDEVVTVQPMPRRGTRVGAASNQADMTMNSDDVRTIGYNGTGVEVGILSDSFNDFGGGTVSGSDCAATVTGTSSQNSGDLPGASGAVRLLDDCTLAFCSVTGTTPCLTNADCPMGETCEPHPNCTGLSDEGRAIGELISDIAPSTTFSFHSAFNSPADFAGGITELANCGADLIVDDVFWTQQAFFQDGIIAQAAQGAVNGGVPYFSAAGNDATFGIDEVFVDPFPDEACAGLYPGAGDMHVFDGAEQFASVTIPDGCNFYAELQWDQPFGSIGASPGSATDLDLYLLSTEVEPDSVSGTNILASSTSDQGGGPGCPGPPAGDPLEFIFYENFTGASDTVFLVVIGCCSGAQTDRFRIVTLSFNCNTTVAPWDFEDGELGEDTIFVDSQIFGHPAAKDVVAVAATFYREIDLGGEQDPPLGGQLDVEPFSSLGGDLPFYFDENGNPLPMAPVNRFKPEVTGPDGTNTTFFGCPDPPGTPCVEGDDFPNFFGTSAAAPNSAAIAALILDATELKINPLPLKQLLSQGARDMEQILLPGIDDLSGSGFTDALRPIRSLDPTNPPLIDELEFDLDGGDFFKSLPTPNQRVQAISKLTLGNGNFDGVEGVADEIIFADGFESGDTSSWSN